MKANSQPLVSIVTPFYNTARYLAECIDSVLAQNYDNWEYILANNCSTDGSREIAAAYAERDPRIRLVDNDRFLGQVQNYNQALRQISPTSVYCKIVQADDWIFPDCLKAMVALAVEHPRVGIVGSYYLNGTQVLGSGLPYPSTMVPGAEICRWHLRYYPERYLFGTPTSLLFRSDLVRARQPFYDEESLLEDYEVCYELLQESDFGFVHQVLTFLRVEEDSLTGQISDFYPYLLHAFICLKKYGRLYLPEDEYETRLRNISKRYFAALARGYLEGAGKEFRTYHRRGLQSIDYRLSPLTLAKHLACELLDLFRHPKAAARLLARYLA
ncbi:hypothetical protein GURASL_19620 [Geotalea uraniireducens]|uniref:Glycosyltransferase 2-like domain-containing protein n=1 Tax=Geotalea uraniireducens TaxID=351604 RepID=A0ABM8EKG6_9BACT|nr:glycosyltransferase family 2 protein [Geotalea uraniireducens]BDV43039.1 hypothetical protein GURASL_19620 [Geotalea uraniireducens]